MRRSVSRGSKLSTDGQDFSENLFPGVSEPEWQEFLEKEETDMFILSVREEILQKCMEICFQNYLEKQAVGFTVHCAFLAWCKVFNMYYMFRDPGDADEPEVKDSWKADPEPPPSRIDSWGVDCITCEHPNIIIEKRERKETKTEFKSPKTHPESLDSCSFISDMLDAEEGGYLFLPSFRTTLDSSKVSREPSIFTRTLSMSRESLPLINPDGELCKNRFTGKKKNSLYV